MESGESLKLSSRFQFWIKIMSRLFTLIFISIFFALGLVYAQTPSPDAGKYSCLTTQLSNAPNAPLGSVIFIPAAFGNIILDGKGNYKLPTLKNSGSYKFDKTTSKLTFTTGDLTALKASRPGFDNGRYRFILTYQTISYECSHQPDGNNPVGTDNKPRPPGILNKGLKGSLIVSTANRYLGFVGSVYTVDLATGKSNPVFADGVGVQNIKGEILHFDKQSRLKLTDKTGNITIKQLTERTSANFDDFYPAISASGEYYALSAPNTNESGIFAGMATSGTKLIIYNRNGKKVADFSGYTHAAWRPNGGLIVAGDNDSARGLFIIDANLKTVKKLVDGFETAQFPAVSPDDKTVAFVKNGEIWTIGINGTNPKVAILGGKAGFPVWSPDGKYIAALNEAVLPGQVTSKNLIFVAKFNTTEGFYLYDNANQYLIGGNRISWVSDTPITSTVSTRDTNARFNSGTSYNPTAVNKDPNFAKANEIYRQVMGDDLDDYNDVAAAITYIVVLNYTYLHQLEGVPTNQVRKVYRQFVDKLLQTDGFQNADNETKQQLAELAILDAIETVTAVKAKNQSKLNEVTLRILRKYVGKSADKLKITDNGMEF
jgi:WD40-like Beta Propeller Repeat